MKVFRIIVAVAAVAAFAILAHTQTRPAPAPTNVAIIDSSAFSDEKAGIARVMADPIRIPGGEDPGGWTDVVYYRLHGSPETYRSCYSEEYLESMAHRIEEDLADGREAWCMFDNTARNFATTNGLYLLDRLAAGPQP